MNKSGFVLLFVFGWLFLSHSQKNINDYKYVVVPLQFDFVKGQDQYRINTLTRYLFKNNGFEAFFDVEELPEDLFKDRCLAMYANVVKLKGGIKTKLQIELKDCKGNLILKSQVGTNKIKAYAKSYPLAIRTAFESIKLLNYTYIPKASTDEPKTDANRDKEVKRLQDEIEVLKAEKEAKEAKEVKEAKAAKEKFELEKNKKIIEVKSPKLEDKPVAKVVDEEPNDILHARSTTSGFQLMDASSKAVMVLLKTAAQNVYIVRSKDAIVFKAGDAWFYSENDSKKELNIKF